MRAASVSWVPLTIAVALLVLSASPAPAESGQHRHRVPEAPAITVFDYSPALSDAEPAAVTGKIVDVAVGPNFSFSFVPSTVTIVVGDTVRWTWGSGNHTVTSGSQCVVDNAYCSPNDPANCSTAGVSNTNAVYSHTFTQPGTFPYFCRVHCLSGMTGTVNVVTPFITITSVTRDGNGFTISGKTTPNTTITIQASPDLVMQFQNPTTTTSNAAGVFSFTDMTATSATARFYRATYP